MIVFISLLASVPPVSTDALTHHLAVPKLYLKHGGIYEIPHLEASYYPMNLELLYLIPMYFKNDIIPKFIHFAFGLITAAMLYWYLKQHINKAYALLGVLFLTIPIIIRLSSIVYVDLGLICFLFVSILILFKWIESGFKSKYLIFSAAFCGLALGTKYNGLIGLFLLSLFTAFVYARYNASHKFYHVKSIGWCALFVIVALTVFSPWMIRNYAWTGNPVYPLYKGIFNAGEKVSAKIAPDNAIQARAQMSHINVRCQIYKESWLEIALIPARVFFQGKDYDPQFFDGRTNPFLLILPIFAFFGLRYSSRQENTEKWMLLFSRFFFYYLSVYSAASASDILAPFCRRL